MEKIIPTEKTGSFIGRHVRRKSSGIPSPKDHDLPPIIDDDNAWREQVHEVDNHDVDQVSQDVDRFTETLSAVDKDNPPEVPDVVETFSKIVESRLAKCYSSDSGAKSGKMTEEDSFFLEAVRRISKLTSAFSDFRTTAATTSSLNRTSMVLQRAMMYLEEEFRNLLEDSGKFDDTDREADRESTGKDEDYPSYPAAMVTKMTRFAAAMVSGGYETECCQVFSISRRKAFTEELKRLGFDAINIDDVQKLHWEKLEGEIQTWTKSAKHCAAKLFPGERKLCDTVFSESPTNSVFLFSNLARAVVIQLLSFAEAVVLTKRQPEKLFKYLDMFETLRDLQPAINKSCSEDCARELTTEISTVGDRIGEAIGFIFCDLETSIKSDHAKTPVPGGAIHPLTRYVMNYLKYACEYKDTLEQIFQKNKSLVEPSEGSDVSSSSPFITELLKVMDLLDANLDAKAKLYKDPSLGYIFLMNNGRYILQKIKGSNEILDLIGNTWYRSKSTVVRQYHKNYTRETWGRVLQILGHDGVQVNGKVHKPALKDRFKSFNNMVEDIHKTQGTWIISDEQLQSELRVSITAVVIPAYRSFLGRFKQYLDSGRHADKYIKYQPEDIETIIDELFEGNPNSMVRRR